MKKANQHLLKNKLSTWVTLDGPLHEEWCASMNGLFNRDKVTIVLLLFKKFRFVMIIQIFRISAFSSGGITVGSVGCVDCVGCEGCV